MENSLGLAALALRLGSAQAANLGRGFAGGFSEIQRVVPAEAGAVFELTFFIQIPARRCTCG
jgi:hypothetical protein